MFTSDTLKTAPNFVFTLQHQKNRPSGPAAYGFRIKIMKELGIDDLKQIDEYRWLVPRQGKMRTDGMVYLDRKLLEFIKNDKSITQVANVAWLPGIVGRSLAMPDMHQGYGFPIGGVAAFDPDQGIVSPGGVGYDINCGVRLLRTTLEKEEVVDHIPLLVDKLFASIPSGVGSK